MRLVPRLRGALPPEMRGASCIGFTLQLQTDGVLEAISKFDECTVNWEHEPT
jgi:hypothetical protein